MDVVKRNYLLARLAGTWRAGWSRGRGLGGSLFGLFDLLVNEDAADPSDERTMRSAEAHP